MTVPWQAPDCTFTGILQPLPPPIPGTIKAGQNLDNFLQQWIAGVSYLDGTLVRPRWQPEPANIPDSQVVDWCAVGITNQRQTGPYQAAIWDVEHGYQERQRHEEFTLLCSFYGPNCDGYASNLADGASVAQNRWILRTVGIALVEVGESRHAPEMIKQRWVDRYDKEVYFRRIIRQNYPVLSFLGASFQINLGCGNDLRNLPPIYVPSAYVTLDDPQRGLDSAALLLPR